MKGGHIVEFLKDFHSGSLSPDIHNRVKTHLIFCLACREADRQFPSQNIPTPPTVPTPVKITEAGEEKKVSIPLVGFLTFLGIVVLTGLIRLISNHLPTSTPSKEIITPPVPESTPTPLPITETPVVKSLPTLPPVEKKPPLLNHSFTDLSGNSSLIHEPLTEVIDQELEWETFWKKFAGENSQAPLIAFDESDVLAIFSGAQTNPSASIEIQSIENTSWEGKPAQIVHYRLNQDPAQAKGHEKHAYFPYKIFKVSKLKGSLFFRFHP